MRKSILFVAILIVIIISATLVGCAPKVLKSEGQNYTIPMVDLSMENTYGEQYNSLYNNFLIDNDSNYLAHPDTVLLKNGNLMTMYPEGHGKGAIRTKISSDGGKTWKRKTDTPKSWDDSKETPTIYRLQLNDGSEKLVMTSAVPNWWGDNGKLEVVGNGFNASYSNDDGETWSEFQNFYGKDSEYSTIPIVAMASLTRLKDANGNWTDSWMGFFHDAEFYNYKSILTFEGSTMKWSVPEKYFSDYRKIEQGTNMCEVEVIRSENGNGNELCLITRSNTKMYNSLVSFSSDEGKTWSEPKELPAAINGERHKAEWLPDGRLFITFRSIERAKDKILAYGGNKKTKFVSEGWVAWVGSYSDLKNCTEGQYRIKLAHTYLDKQTTVEKVAHADTGYCGNAVLPDGTIFTSTYGRFDASARYTDKYGASIPKTSIMGKRIDIKLVDELVKLI